MLMLLLLLSSSVVVVYWACDRPSPVVWSTYGLDLALVDFIHPDQYGGDDEFGAKCEAVKRRNLTLTQRSQNCYQVRAWPLSTGHFIYLLLVVVVVVVVVVVSAYFVILLL